MASEPGQSGQTSQPAGEEHPKAASPTQVGMPAAEPAAGAQQTVESSAAYQPFPYGYPVYTAYPPYLTYTPYSPNPYAPYPAYPYYPTPVAPTTSALAIASFICGLLTLFAFPYLGIAAVICGHLSLGQIRSSGGFVEGRGFAIAGLILGYVMLGLGIIGFLLYFLFVFFLISRPIPAGFVFPLPS
ncbi:MAG TPA: DUF4190 domain-containing protein [Ktedonobacterales bacterium]